MKNIQVVLIGFLAGIAGAYSLSLFQKEKEKDVWVQNLSPFSTSQNVNVSSAPMNTNFIEASSASTPCVVFIKNTSVQNVGMDMFGWFFGGREQTQVSTGSGVIINKSGYILTNNHVIDNSENIEVIHAKKSYKAKIVGTDPSTDLALLKIESDELPAIKVGSSKSVQVGEWVLAVGNPFNLQSTVTAGIVSAKGRDINIVTGRFPLESFIQTDAAINPGNSGGALVNIRGELIGINTAILSHTGSYSGYGFAVPIDIAMKVVKDILEFGEVQKAFFGADVRDLNTDLANKLHTKDLNGVAVINVLANEAADKAGIKNGDIITHIDGVMINSKAEFDEQISYYRPGNKVKITYRRDDKNQETTINLTNREGTYEMLKKETFTSSSLGAELENVSKVEKDKLGIKSGIRIAKVFGNGLIARMGIEEGFIIASINNREIGSAKELEEIMSKIHGKVVIEGISPKGARGYYSFFF